MYTNCLQKFRILLQVPKPENKTAPQILLPILKIFTSLLFLSTLIGGGFTHSP